MIEIKRIVCAIDFSEFSRHALNYAVAMARWYESRVSALHVFSSWPVVDMIPSLPPQGMQRVVLSDAERQALVAQLEGFVASSESGVHVEPVLAEAPDVHREILAHADVLDADLLVMGSHGRSGFERLLLGSTTEKVLRKASCPVMVVPSHAGGAEPSRAVHFGRILCPVDFSGASLTALEYSISLAEEADARLTALHVVEIPAGLYEASAAFDVDQFRKNAEEASMKRLRGLIPDSVRTYCDVETVVADGRTSHEILKTAASQKSDLIVMGVHGRGAVDLMMFGSNTHHVIQSASCPVLTIRER